LGGRGGKVRELSARCARYDLNYDIKGGPEPSILDDFCLGNVTSKCFSKLRFGTSQIQPELKCLENILSSFHESLLRARLCEHELFNVCSIAALISTVVKSPDVKWDKYKAFWMVDKKRILHQ